MPQKEKNNHLVSVAVTEFREETDSMQSLASNGARDGSGTEMKAFGWAGW